MERHKFYKYLVNKFIKNKESKIIVFGAGKTDMQIFNESNFKNVTFSNLNPHDGNFKKINIHKNNLDNLSYDYCVAHASIHHSSQPHNSILEMYRVAKSGILVIESNDSILMRAAVKMKLAEDFEISAVKNGSTGVDETYTPNYVYRWTEREIIKLINSYKPNLNHKIIFEYNYHLRLENKKMILINLILKIFFKIFRKQQNLLGIFINKKVSTLRN